jgi:Lrp/AsnC family leucine-responsive transcriptional regulator
VEQLRTLPGVTRTNTTIVLSSVKESAHVRTSTRSAKGEP